MNKKGITLIAVILLMTLLAITALSLTAFVVERLRFTAVRQNEINAYYMAQAGIHYGIFQYEANNQLNGTYEYTDTDRKFEWDIIELGEVIDINSIGHAPKEAGSDQIQKALTATYNTSTGELTYLGYQ